MIVPRRVAPPPRCSSHPIHDTGPARHGARNAARPGRRPPRGARGRSPGCRCWPPGCLPRTTTSSPSTALTRFTSTRRESPGGRTTTRSPGRGRRRPHDEQTVPGASVGSMRMPCTVTTPGRRTTTPTDPAPRSPTRAPSAPAMRRYRRARRAGGGPTGVERRHPGRRPAPRFTARPAWVRWARPSSIPPDEGDLHMRIVDLLLSGVDRFSPPATVHAHCDLPCGVYDPAQARIEAESVKACMEKFNASDDEVFKERRRLHQGAACRARQAPPVGAVDRLLQARAPGQVPRARTTCSGRPPRPRARRRRPTTRRWRRACSTRSAEIDTIFWETKK